MDSYVVRLYINTKTECYPSDEGPHFYYIYRHVGFRGKTLRLYTSVHVIKSST